MDALWRPPFPLHGPVLMLSVGALVVSTCAHSLVCMQLHMQQTVMQCVF